MAERLTDQTAITTTAPGDFVYTVDVSDTTDDPAGSSKKITVGDFFLSANQKTVTGFDGYAIIAGSGNTDDSQVELGDILIGIGSFNGGNFSVLVANQNAPTLDAHFDIWFQASDPNV